MSVVKCKKKTLCLFLCLFYCHTVDSNECDAQKGNPGPPGPPGLQGEVGQKGKAPYTTVVYI